MLIYGAGLHGVHLYHLVKNRFSESYQVVGFVDDSKPVGHIVVDSLENAGGLHEVSRSNNFNPGNVNLIFGIGYSNMNGRMEAFRNAIEAGYEVMTLIHPAAVIEPTASLGKGAVVMAGAVIDHACELADACFIDMGVHISEYCNIGNNNYIAAGTAIGGYVNMADSNFFGLNCTVTDHIDIGSRNNINAQTLVYKSVGNDVRLVEFHEQHEITKM